MILGPDGFMWGTVRLSGLSRRCRLQSSVQLAPAPAWSSPILHVPLSLPARLLPISTIPSNKSKSPKNVLKNNTNYLKSATWWRPKL